MGQKGFLRGGNEKLAIHQHIIYVQMVHFTIRVRVVHDFQNKRQDWKHFPTNYATQARRKRTLISKL